MSILASNFSQRKKVTNPSCERGLSIINIDERLKAVASMIRGEVIADIGSDHAYLSVWLYLNKKIKKAYASDISEICVNKIKANLKRYNISEEYIVPVLSDGLTGLENIPELTDIIIAGMGGENIAGIVHKIPGVNFILQPNSKVEYLRKFLYANGFDIIRETVAEDEKRFYNIINAKFTGVKYTPEFIEIVAGKNIRHAGYINKILKRFADIIRDLDASEKSEEKYEIKTEFGYYKDIEDLIAGLKKLL